MRLFNWKVNVLLFFFTAVTIWLLQFVLLRSALDLGFKADDWELYLRYKSLGSAPLTKLGQVWAERGLYTTYQIYYMGLLDFIVGFNHQLFKMTDIIFKFIATLSLFPLILIIFRKRMLAFLTTFMFAISHASVGPLEFVVKGSDYVAIFFMNMFLIVYYLVLRKKLNFLWLITAAILLILSMIFSPIRMFPLLAIPPLIEAYLLIKNPKVKQLRKTFIRMLIFYSPFILLVLHIPSILVGGPLLTLYKRVVIEGNWNILLSPISGFGYTLITDQYLSRIFGLINTDTLMGYIGFLFGGPLVIFGVLTILFAILQSKKPGLFFITVFISNFIAEILVFFIAFNYRYLPIKHQVNFEPSVLYPVLFGIYILILSIAFFVEWSGRDDKDILLLPLWIGSAFLTIFTFATWAFAPDGTGFTATSYYLVVASSGTSLFLAAFLNSLYNKAKDYHNGILSFLIIVVSFIFIITFFVMSSRQIDKYFKYLNANGGNAKEQVMMQEKVRQILRNFNMSKPALFYFDVSELGEDGYYMSETLLLTFASWMHFQDAQIIDGCLEAFHESKEELAKLVQIRDGQKGFVYRSLCVDKGEKGVYYNRTYAISHLTC